MPTLTPARRSHREPWTLLSVLAEPPCPFPARSAAHAHARRRDLRRLGEILGDRAHATEREEILARLNAPALERLAHRAPSDRDAVFVSGPLAALGAEARAAALNPTTQEVHA